MLHCVIRCTFTKGIQYASPFGITGVIQYEMITHTMTTNQVATREKQTATQTLSINNKKM